MVSRISIGKIFRFASSYWKGNSSFQKRNWEKATKEYKKSLSNIANNANSLSGAFILSRLSISANGCDNITASEGAYQNLKKVIYQIRYRNVEEKKWMIFYTEYLGQLLGFENSDLEKIDKLQPDLVSPRIKRDFDIEDMQNHISSLRN